MSLFAFTKPEDVPPPRRGREVLVTREVADALPDRDDLVVLVTRASEASLGLLGL